jgi:hypothetical protein
MENIMTVDTTFAAKRFLKTDTIFVLFSTATNLPFLECDQTTFLDQAYAFTDEDTMKQYASIFTKAHFGLRALLFPCDRYQLFFDQLYAMGADSIQFVEEGAPISIRLEELGQMTPPPELGKGIPALNTEFSLTSAYFMQDARRHMEREQEDMHRLRELEEEMAATMLRSRFILAFDTSRVKGKWDPMDKSQQVGVPQIKDKQGRIFQPIYSDIFEFRRFNAANGNELQLSITAVDYDALPKLLHKPAEAFVINPAGVNLTLNPLQLEEMKKRYAQG